MVRRGTRKRVDRSDWTGFLAAAEENYASACTILGERKYRAAGILLVHAAIALTDALTGRAGGVKSTGEHHRDAFTSNDIARMRTHYERFALWVKQQLRT